METENKLGSLEEELENLSDEEKITILEKVLGGKWDSSSFDLGQPLDESWTLAIRASWLEDIYHEELKKKKRMRTGNSSLRNAIKQKNDEFYTKFEDIEEELSHYKDHFKNKVVLCNCDHPIHSQFYRFFVLNFKEYGLKKLISTFYKDGGNSYKCEMTRGSSGELYAKKTERVTDGDFRNEESLKILEEADIVVTNPPFSLFREYITQLMKFEKKFLVIGNMNAITYKEVFPLIHENKMWGGAKGFSSKASTSMTFDLPKDRDGETAKFGNIMWFTNLSHDKKNEELKLVKAYDPQEYLKYDNYDAINVDKLKDIPCDYFEPMGVPITYILKHNPAQFEVIGLDRYLLEKVGDSTISGKAKFKRIIIKRAKTLNL